MRTLLVIEDEAPLRESILTILTLEGFEVIGASNGLEGVELAREHSPDLIIADIMLPGLDGYGVLRELRQRSSTATIPFIFLTARSNWDDMRRGMELGADDYIPKPFHSKELLAAIQTQFEKQSTLESARLRALSHFLVEAQESERTRIAHELHDDIGLILNGLKVTLGMSKHLPNHAMRAIVNEAENVIDSIINRLKQLSRDLRPAILDTLGLLPALHQFLEQHPFMAKGQLHFSHQGLERRFPSELETTFYRIVQKTLDEIEHSAPEANLWLNMWADSEVISLEIEDRNKNVDLKTNFNTNPAAVFVEMIERVTLMGGQLMIESTPNTRTRVFAQLPITVSARRPTPQVAALSGLSGVTPVLEAGDVEDTPESETVTQSQKSQVPKLRIALADTHDWIRQGLRTLFEADADVKVVSEIQRLEDAGAECERQKPNLLIIDPTLPDEEPFGMIAGIKERAPDTHILVLSTQVEAVYIAEIFRSGATGYALKESRADDLRTAMRTVAAGKRYVSPSLVIERIDSYLSDGDPEPDTQPQDILTQREIEVLQLIVEGYKNTEIAEILSISPRTVETHRANMKRKLDLRTQANLIRFAIEHNLTTDV